jgi:hypothetical protein
MKKVIFLLSVIILICSHVTFTAETDQPKLNILTALDGKAKFDTDILPKNINLLTSGYHITTWTWLTERYNQKELHDKLQKATTQKEPIVVFASGSMASVALDEIAKLPKNNINALFLHAPEFSDNYYNVHNVEIIRGKNIPIIFMRGGQKEFLNSEVIYAHHHQNECKYIHLIETNPTSENIGAILEHYKAPSTNNNSIPFQPQLKGVGVANRYLNLKMNEVFCYYWSCAKVGASAAFAGLIVYLLSKTEIAAEMFEKISSYK